jgi:CRISPR type III-A-associated RAMP protein Csm4
MNPGLIVKLRPSGPWRIGPDSGARNRVDVIYHSDSLYSAVTSAMARLGWLEEWLDATARTGAPAVSFSSCFPYLDDIVFVVPPRTLWPPASTSAKAAKVRWKNARFVPLTVVQSILAGLRPDENQWSVDGPSDCLVPAGSPGPFRTAVRWSAGVDRLTGASERHSTACIEFRAGSGLWTAVSFEDDVAQARWSGPVKAAFRLLADTGFGGERSRGWGRSEAPEFTEGFLPDLILPLSITAVAPVEAMEAAVKAVSPVAAMVVEPEAPAVEAAPAGQSELPTVEAVQPELPPAVEVAPEVPAVEVAPATESEVPAVEAVPATESEAPAVEVASATESETPAVEAAPAAEPEVPAVEAAPATESEAPAVEAVPATESEVPAVEVASATESEAPAVEAVPATESAVPAVEAVPATESEVPAVEAAPTAESEAPAVEAAPAVEPEVPAVEAAPTAESEVPAVETAPAAESEVPAVEAAPTAEPEVPAVEAAPAAESEGPAVEAAPTAESEAPAVEAPAAEPEVPAVEAAPAAKSEAPSAEPAVHAAPATAPPVPAAPTHPHWLLSLFTPAPADSVDWRRGNYTVLARGGRVDSPAGSGELKKQIQMVAEGSVLYAEATPRGSAANVAPDGFAHPVFRAGFALAIPLPEVR